MAEFDPEKAIAYAELNIWAKHMDIKMLSGLLENSGDCDLYSNAHVKFSPAEKEGDFDIWTYKTEKRPTYYLYERINELISVFDKKTYALKKIKDSFEDCSIVVEFVLENYQISLPGMALHKAQIKFMSDIEADFDMDIYYYGPEETEE